MAMIGGEPRWSRLVSILVLLFAGILSVALVYSQTMQDPSTLKWNSWAFHEWLINFEGGFVRRGLAGHIIRRMAPASEVAIVNLIVFVLFLLFVVVSIAFALVFVVGPRATAFFVLCPLSFLSMAIWNHYYFRKEITFYIGIFLVAVLVALLRARDARLIRGVILAVIGLWTAIGPFIHEGFIFFCVFIFSLILAELVGDKSRRAVVLSYLVLSFLLFGLMAYFAGSETVVKQIWLSLSEQSRSLGSSASPMGGISAIGWSTRYAASLTANAIISGMAAYYILSLIIVYFVVAIIVSAQRRLSMIALVTSPQFVSGFALILISFLPLFVVAWDWGRVIGGVYVVALAFFSLRFDDGAVATVMPWTPMVAMPASLTVAALIVLSLMKVPECCIHAYDGNRASGSLLNFARQLFP